MALLLSGCKALSFYRPAIAGEYQILAHQQPIGELLANPDTPAQLKVKFDQVLRMRLFAQHDLGLPADDEYLKYVDLHRPYVVWNVNVAKPLSLTPKTWWFPIIGRASYRGYFEEKQARSYGGDFEKKGWDVYVDGVVTYSTLGWFHDPLLNTFINEPESYLAEVIFHELTHRRLFIAGDTDFNEGLAVAVSEEGVRRWCQTNHQAAAYEKYLRNLDNEHAFVRLVMTTRDRLQAVYEDPKLSTDEKLRRKGEVIEQLRAEYAELKKQLGGKAGYDAWIAAPINNAKLNTVSAYFDLVPGFRALLKQNGGDLQKFFVEAEKLGKLPLKERHAALQGPESSK
jgi:predicted aminopeptidase